jgi:hypothetical protein
MTPRVNELPDIAEAAPQRPAPGSTHTVALDLDPGAYLP